ncbi:MAG: low-specificity L-threonine aldolase [Desulfatiglandaceae bacterium]|jgi:threonine aldolase
MKAKTIDLRSDTVTRPTVAMRAAMTEADLGDDVYGEDPTVNRLEELAAHMIGTEAAIFATSGTQSNLLALLSHCERGDEYIVGQLAHTYRYEGGGAAIFGSIQPQPLDFAADGTLDLEKAAEVIKPDNFHFAHTRLFCLENTQAGRALPLGYLSRAGEFVHKHHLKMHLDGARVFNAAIKLSVPVQEITHHFDSVSVCLSKGLGAPVGSVLCSTSETIKKARRWRKVLGGGMRQAGVLAAAGIYALKNNVKRLEEDHRNAALLAEGLSGIEGLNVEYSDAQTNMVFIEPPKAQAAVLPAYLSRRDILITGGKRVRLVTHLDVDRDDITLAIRAFKDFFAAGESLK